MLQTIVGLHSFWRWVVLLVVLVAIVRGLMGWLRGGRWEARDRQFALLATTALDIQLLLGLVLWIGQSRWNDGVFFRIIHPVVMISAIVIAHVASLQAKKATSDTAKFRALAVGLIVAMVLITAAIPSKSWMRIWA